MHLHAQVWRPAVLFALSLLHRHSAVTSRASQTPHDTLQQKRLPCTDTVAPRWHSAAVHEMPAERRQATAHGAEPGRRDVAGRGGRGRDGVTRGIQG
jgi:hypothetical protein